MNPRNQRLQHSRLEPVGKPPPGPQIGRQRHTDIPLDRVDQTRVTRPLDLRRGIRRVDTQPSGDPPPRVADRILHTRILAHDPVRAPSIGQSGSVCNRTGAVRREANRLQHCAALRLRRGIGTLCSRRNDSSNRQAGCGR
ncbi:hypothetical protein GCM10020218_018400 [Dactylosporangium vinaceum]